MLDSVIHISTSKLKVDWLCPKKRLKIYVLAVPEAHDKHTYDRHKFVRVCTRHVRALTPAQNIL